MEWPDEIALVRIRASVRAAGERLRLPLRNRTWRGIGGNWQGTGVGNSIDFQDHRQYLPGDDPRYIDWHAYARTGHYSMKLYREEVSPRVDLVLDATASMTLDAAKQRRSLELFYFSLESALRVGASVRCFVVRSGSCVPWAADSALAGAAPPEGVEVREDILPGILLVPWRSGSLRVWVSDLLFPGAPDVVLSPMAAAKGRGVLLVPHCKGESDPDWSGNVELHDVETGVRRSQNIGADTAARYRDAYARHFQLWAAHAPRHGVVMARVAAEPGFSEALGMDAVAVGAVEWND